MTDLMEPTPVARNNPHPISILGLEMDQLLTIDDALDRIGVKGEDIWLEDIKTVDSGLPVPHNYAVVSSEFGVMGVHGTRYEIMTRRDILTIAYSIIGLDPEGRHLHAIGNLGEASQRFFAYIKDHDLVIDPNGVADKIERGYMVATSYDASLRSYIGRTAIRLSCSNMLKMALKGMTDSISVMHRGDAESRIRVQAADRYAGAWDKKVQAAAEKMLGVDGNKALNKILKQAYPDKGLDGAAETRRQQARSWIQHLYDGAGNFSADKVGPNGWAAYNAYVEFLDFHLEVRGGDKEVKRAERAVFPSQVQLKKIRAADAVLSLN